MRGGEVAESVQADAETVAGVRETDGDAGDRRAGRRRRQFKGRQEGKKVSQNGKIKIQHILLNISFWYQVS